MWYLAEPDRGRVRGVFLFWLPNMVITTSNREWRGKVLGGLHWLHCCACTMPSTPLAATAFRHVAIFLAAILLCLLYCLQRVMQNWPSLRDIGVEFDTENRQYFWALGFWASAMGANPSGCFSCDVQMKPMKQKKYACASRTTVPLWASVSLKINCHLA